MTYYAQYQQLHVLQQSFRQTRTAVQGEEALKQSGTNVVIVAGSIPPEQMSLQDARFVASISSDPEKTETIFIPGDIDHIGRRFEEKIAAIALGYSRGSELSGTGVSRSENPCRDP